MWFLYLSGSQRVALPLERSSSTSEDSRNLTETRRPPLQDGRCGWCSQTQAQLPPPKVGIIGDTPKARFCASLPTCYRGRAQAGKPKAESLQAQGLSTPKPRVALGGRPL